MRVLLLMRGSPGSGKTTWIEKNGLKRYALSADDIRMLTSSPELQPDGRLAVSQANDKFVWENLFRILTARMMNGEFTVIDATNSKTTEMKRYKELCEQYRYRCYIVDFTGVPIETAKRQNLMRPVEKQVPEQVIDNMYARFATQKIPAGITAIMPDELTKIWYRKTDLSDWEKIHVFGDLHGCASCLQDYLIADGGMHDDELYIFTGDYIDRGIENAELMRFLLSVYEKPNTLFLEGNHERWLWIWANGGVAQSKEFELHTRGELERGGIDKKEARKFYRKLGQCAYFEYRGKTYFISHGGISMLPDNLTLVSSRQMIHGVGNYDDAETVDNTFNKIMGDSVIQIHGHRNTKRVKIRANDTCFNLEGNIEFGGGLRCIELCGDGSIAAFVTQNKVFKDQTQEEAAEGKQASETVAEAILALRKNKYVQEKQYGDISSFNFTKQAFYDKIWDEQTIRARGLYINVPKQKIVCRAYNKFFNVNERPETKFDMLQYRLHFPVAAYVKENGFLGLVSYNEESDDLFFATKSSPIGDYAEWLRANFNSMTTQEQRNSIKQIAKDQNVTFVFECVDMVHAPHIIEYDRNHMFLLDVVQNDLEFKKLPYRELIKIGRKCGVEVKEQAYVIGNWQEFYDWYHRVLEVDYLWHGKPIEGFVIEDSDGNMVKLKLSYYNFWKFMRGVAHETIRKGYIDPRRTSALTTPTANFFYGWLKSYREVTPAEDIPGDICSLRKMFYKNRSNGTEI